MARAPAALPWLHGRILAALCDIPASRQNLQGGDLAPLVYKSLPGDLDVHENRWRGWLRTQAVRSHV